MSFVLIGKACIDWPRFWLAVNSDDLDTGDDALLDPEDEEILDSSIVEGKK